MPTTHRRCARPVVLALLLAMTMPLSAEAAKWHGVCPTGRSRLYIGGNGVLVPWKMVNVGHDVEFYLKESWLEKTGGFSTEPQGNTVHIRFMPYRGEPIELPPFTVTAITPSMMRFPMPDSRTSIGRLLVGSASFVVKRGETVVMRSYKQTVMPPMNDMRALAAQGGEADVLGTIDDSARKMYIPISFGGFGVGDPMPSCPTATLSRVTAFAIEASLRKRDGQLIPHANIADLKKTWLYYGDYDLWGDNLYGSRFMRLPKIRRLRDGSFALCALNDLFDVILVMKLQQSARGQNSEIVPVQQDGSPFTLKLRNVSAEVVELPTLPSDSLGAVCPVTP